MTTPADAIRARRKLTNRLIAGQEAQRLRPFFTEDAVVIVGDGAVIHGADNVVAAFAGQFADPDFVTFERTADTVEIDAEGLRAAETGRWIGRWTAAPAMSGAYMAAWRKVRGQWMIERELYVTLA